MIEAANQQNSQTFFLLSFFAIFGLFFDFLAFFAFAIESPHLFLQQLAFIVLCFELLL